MKQIMAVSVLGILLLMPLSGVAQTVFDSDVASVDLIIQPYMTVNIVEDALDLIVTASDFANGWVVTQTASDVYVQCNVAARVKCLDTLELTRVGGGADPQTIYPSVSLDGGPEYNDGTWSYVLIDAGDHGPADISTTIVYVNMALGVDDIAGVYTGTLTIYVEQQ